MRMRIQEIMHAIHRPRVRIETCINCQADLFMLNWKKETFIKRLTNHSTMKSIEKKWKKKWNNFFGKFELSIWPVSLFVGSFFENRRNAKPQNHMWKQKLVYHWLLVASLHLVAIVVSNTPLKYWRGYHIINRKSVFVTFYLTVAERCCQINRNTNASMSMRWEHMHVGSWINKA